jgi:hypothetical protein
LCRLFSIDLSVKLLKSMILKFHYQNPRSCETEQAKYDD